MKTLSFPQHTLSPDVFPYPGPPLLVAIDIMKAFPSATKAFKSTPHGWTAAQGNAKVRGAGDMACAGVQVLKHFQLHRSVEAAITYSRKLWVNSTGPGSSNFEKNHEAGLCAAKGAESEFMALATAWRWDENHAT